MNIKATPFCFRMERAENETVAIFTHKKKRLISGMYFVM